MIKNDKLDALIMLSGDVLIKKNVSSYKNTDTSATVRPKSLDKRVQRTINKENRRREYGRFYKYGRRIAAAVLIICTISFVAILSVDATRKAIWNAIVNFFNEYFCISYDTETQQPDKLKETKELFYEAEGWEKQIVMNTDSLRTVFYRKNGVKVLTYSQELVDKQPMWFDFDNEDTDGEKLKIRGNSAYLMAREDQQTYSLNWCDGVYVYSLESYSPEISKEELILMAETIE